MAKKLEKKRLLSQKVIVLTILTIVLGVIVYFGLRTLDIGNPVVATINGESVTHREFSTRYAQLPQAYAEVITKEAFLQELIDVRLLLQQARAEGIVIRNGEIDDALALLEQQLPEGTSLETFLEEQNLKQKELRSDLEDQLLINHLINRTILSSLYVTEEEVLSFYQDHLEDFVVEDEQIPFEQIQEPLRQQILFEKTNFAVSAYLAQLRSSSTIELGDIREEDLLGGFREVGEQACYEDERLVVSVFTTSTCVSCSWVEPALLRALEGFGDALLVYRWELDTGDNLATGAVESGVAKEFLNQFKAFNKEGKIPFYLIGCTHARAGNRYSSLVREEEVFRTVITDLINHG